MARPPLARSESSPPSSLSSDEEPPLPVPVAYRVCDRRPVGCCWQRRTVAWAAALLTLLVLSLTSSVIRVRTRELLRQGSWGHAENDGPAVAVIKLGRSVEQNSSREDPPPWLSFSHLDGYFSGLKALVPGTEYTAEYPISEGGEFATPLMVPHPHMPKPTPYVPHPDYDTLEYTSQYHSVHPCYLDKDKSVSIPDIYAYDGVVQGQPKPLTGSHSLLGLREDICFDRFGRYGPYGLGYPSDEGGLQIGLDTENSTSDGVWEKTGKINYDNIDWGDVQDRCFESNKKRFHGPDGQTDATSWLFPKRQKISRTAVVVRAYTDYPWSYHGILNIRALISELALRSGGEYHVHFLLHVRNNTEPIWGDNATVQRILVENVPEEFHSLCTLWSEAQMRLIYPGDFSRSFSNPSNLDIFGVYRSAHLPLQHFAVNHPEYDFFWNWELDIRYIGNYYELFERLGEWAKNQSRVEIWERSAKYYIPAYHGDWANFTSLVHNETIASGRTPIIGPVDFPGREPLTPELQNITFTPPPAPPSHPPHTPPQTPPRQPITPPPSLLRYLGRSRPHNPQPSLRPHLLRLGLPL